MTTGPRTLVWAYADSPPGCISHMQQIPLSRSSTRSPAFSRGRRGVALIDTLAACVLLLLVFAMASGHLAEWSKRVADARSALVQMEIPRRVVAAFAETSSASFFPTGTQAATFDSVTATYTRIANPNTARIPRYEIIVADARPDAAIRPDTFQIDFNPYLMSVTGFDQGDTRP